MQPYQNPLGVSPQTPAPQLQQQPPDAIKQLLVKFLASQVANDSNAQSTPPAQVQQQIGAMNVPQARQDFTQQKGQGDEGNSEVAAIHELMKKQKHSQFLRNLFKLGVPVAAAAAGIASKGKSPLLPAATGLAQGFVGENQRQDITAAENKQKLAEKTVDNNEEQQKESWDLAMKIAKQDSEANLGKSYSIEDLKQLAETVHQVRFGDAAKNANANAQAIRSGDNEMVNIKFNDGSIHPMSLAQAKAQGYTK